MIANRDRLTIATTSLLNIPSFALVIRMKVKIKMNLKITIIDDPTLPNGNLEVIAFPIVSNTLKHKTRRVAFQAGDNPYIDFIRVTAGKSKKH